MNCVGLRAFCLSQRLRRACVHAAFALTCLPAFACSSSEKGELNRSVARQLSIGKQSACASFEDGSTQCWGFRQAGALSDGKPIGPTTPDFQLAPTQVAGLDAGVRQLSIGADACALMDTGAVTCWGAPLGRAFGEVTQADVVATPRVIRGLESEVESLAAGKGGSFNTLEGAVRCAIKTDGTLLCWGDGNWGQLGETVRRSEVPVPIPLVAPATWVAVGTSHVCAALADRSAWCWGSNGQGELGNLVNTPYDANRYSAVPVRVLSLPEVEIKELGAGTGYACALLVSGEVWCWGSGDPLQITSDPLRTDARLIPGLGSVKNLAFGDYHACALRDDGTVRCWGARPYGELGDGVSPYWACRADSADCVVKTPVEPVRLSQVTLIAAGRSSSCAAHADGRIRCWGSNFYGQLGNGTREDTTYPVEVLGP